jgi:hypothetical protein
MYGIEPHDVRSGRIDAATVTPWTPPQGAQVLLPQAEPIRRVILELLSVADSRLCMCNLFTV